MKSITICVLLLALTTASFSQQTLQSIPSVKTDYLQKSKHQKTAAWILLGSGVTVFAIAAPGNVSFDVLGTLVVVGSLSTLGSIPLFIASARNKRKARAATAFFKKETAPVIRQSSFVQNSFPVLSVKINLK